MAAFGAAVFLLRGFGISCDQSELKGVYRACTLVQAEGGQINRSKLDESDHPGYPFAPGFGLDLDLCSPCLHQAEVLSVREGTTGHGESSGGGEQPLAADLSVTRESEERLKRAELIAHLGSWELDLTGNSLSWSDEVYRIFGLEPQEFGAMFMKMAFGDRGMESALRVVRDGRAAIEYLSGTGKYADRKEYPLPSVVLLDLNLPQVPGFEVLKWMRNHPDFARTPVGVFSSSTREDDRVKALELGASEFVGKPSSGLKFGEVVEGLQEKWHV